VSGAGVGAAAREAHGLVRLAAVSPLLKLGDPKENAGRCGQAAARAVEEGARVVVLPELCLTGYSCGDLFGQDWLLERAQDALEELTRASVNWPALVVAGLPWRVEGRLFNMAAVLARGSLLGLVPKSFLPNSGEFYERRWFAPAASLGPRELAWQSGMVPAGTDLLFEAADVSGLRLGVEICEDLWTVEPPSGRAALAGATVLANLSAGNELLGKAGYRRDLVVQQSARCVAAYVYAGAGAGESSTDVVFSGHCMAAENGRLLAESGRFEFRDEMIVADADLKWLEHDRRGNSGFRDQPPPVFRRVGTTLGEAEEGGARLLRTVEARPFVPSDKGLRREACEEIFAIQSTGLARRLRASRAETAVVGLSGGLDSTLALLVMVRALKKAGMPPEAALAVTMPGFGTSDRTRNNAAGLAGALGVPLRQIPIHEAVRRHFADIGHPEDLHDVVYENAQARERTQVLMDVANQTRGIVVGTGDLSEAALGWCTFNGDHMSMYHVNAGVPKTLVRYLIEWCADEMDAENHDAAAILRDIAATPVSPELLPLDEQGGIGQRTEELVGPYELHDFFLYHLVRRGDSRAKIEFLAGEAFAGRGLERDISRWLDVFLRRFGSMQFKRSVMPDGPKVGTVALSPRGDWRMPSDWEGDIG
jgi:NAD+ synthase (glutamine-hydrolysing)